MPPKTKEEIYEYVHNYKNNALGQFNDDAQSLYHRANDIDVKLGSDLIILASAGIALIGGIVASQSSVTNNVLRAFLAFAALMLFLSIGSGLKYYSDVQKFWEAWGDIKHQQAGMVHKDKSQTAEGLEVLIKKLARKGKQVPGRSNVRARQVQVYSFILGVACLCVIIFGTLASNPASSLRNHVMGEDDTERLTY